MNYYLAPMEGITGYAFRNAYRTTFEEFNGYFTPFIPTGNYSKKTLREIAPENNEGINLVPQVLAGRVDDIIELTNSLKEKGFNEININLGCPSGTVTAKKRGSGMLKYPDELESFLKSLFENTDSKISVKTRVGFDNVDEWKRIVEIYQKFDFSNMTIHPRLRSDFYGNMLRIECFDYAYENLSCPLIYNGDINSLEEAQKIKEAYPMLLGIMMGRGILRRPWLLEEIRTGKKTEDIPVLKVKELLEKLESSYAEVFTDDTQVLYRLKEIWCYLGETFDDAKMLKAIKKARRLADYHSAVKL